MFKKMIVFGVLLLGGGFVLGCGDVDRPVGRAVNRDNYVSVGQKYRQRRQEILVTDFSKRVVPVIPPKGEVIRVIIDTDFRNEIDDIWAVALALLSPERFKIEGFVAANFDNERGGPDGIEQSAVELETILRKAGMAGKYPIKRGSSPLRYQYEPSESEGVDFIIEKAMASSPKDPLWVVGLGASTDIASAYLKEPRIVDRVVVFWHFRTRWPKKCYNFNVIGDIRAARLVFHSPLPFVLFDTGTFLRCPMKESERYIKPCGELGRYLHEYRFKKKFYQRSNKGFFDLGDIAALVEPGLTKWEVVDCPEVNEYLDYEFKGTKGKILRCYDINRDKTFRLFYEKLKSFAEKK
ncbi:MAG: nucleoside hydrolase [Planctomycetota bacterium]